MSELASKYCQLAIDLIVAHYTDDTMAAEHVEQELETFWASLSLRDRFSLESINDSLSKLVSALPSNQAGQTTLTIDAVYDSVLQLYGAEVKTKDGTKLSATLPMYQSAEEAKDGALSTIRHLLASVKTLCR